VPECPHLRAARQALTPGRAGDGRLHGFEAPKAFLVGYGLDHVERWRNLPFVGVLEAMPSEAALAR
jgi:hypothetical protein